MISTSLDNQIAKIIRDTRIPDSSYLADMYEWIPEAMRLMKTMVEMPITPYKLHVHNHMAKLPCGLVDFIAVEYKRQRLRTYTGIRPGGSKLIYSTEDNTGFTAYPTYTSMPSSTNLDLEYVQSLPVSNQDGYQLHLDHISTTFETGDITCYIRTTPLDAKGLPLIPDHPDYREAIYWWVRSKLIQSGYLDPVYGRDDRIPNERWEIYAARAISDIVYPSTDQKEAQLAMSVRFIPPTDYYSSFFNTELKEPVLDVNTTTTVTDFASPVGPLLNSQEQ